jgi:pimeloyl-ACP methyl ester carboxylesterase
VGQLGCWCFRTDTFAQVLWRRDHLACRRRTESWGARLHAAFAPDLGESANQFLPEGPLPGTPTEAGLLFMNRDIYLNAFAPDVLQAVKDFMADSQVPIQPSGIVAKATKAAWKTRPTWYLVSAQDAIIPPDNERVFAKRMKATTAEASGRRVAFIAKPEAAAKMIADAARSARQ